MSARLTTEIRDRLKKAVLTHRFQEDVVKLVGDRAAFAEQVYNEIYRKADREKMAALPAGWLVECSHINVQFGHWYGQVTFSGALSDALRGFSGKIEPVNRRVLHRHEHGCAKSFEPDHKLSLTYQDLTARKDALLDECTKAGRQIDAALNAVSTINKLIEAWPEIKPFTDALPAKIATLPAIPTSQLNAILDLPVAA